MPLSVRRAAIASALMVVCGAPAADAAPFAPSLSQTPSAAERAAFESCLADAAENPATVCAGRVADACIAKDGGETTAGMTACDARELALWMARIDTQIGDLDAWRSPAQKRALAAAQAAFVTWRDAKCAFAATIYEGGSLARVVESRCRLETTAAWSGDLADRLAQDDAP